MRGRVRELKRFERERQVEFERELKRQAREERQVERDRRLAVVREQRRREALERLQARKAQSAKRRLEARARKKREREAAVALKRFNERVRLVDEARAKGPGNGFIVVHTPATATACDHGEDDLDKVCNITNTAQMDRRLAEDLLPPSTFPGAIIDPRVRQ